MTIEIVDFPIKNGDFPYFFVCFPEGNMWNMIRSSKVCRDWHGAPQEGAVPQCVLTRGQDMSSMSARNGTEHGTITTVE